MEIIFKLDWLGVARGINFGLWFSYIMNDDAFHLENTMNLWLVIHFTLEPFWYNYHEEKKKFSCEGEIFLGIQKVNFDQLCTLLRQPVLHNKEPSLSNSLFCIIFVSFILGWFSRRA